MHRRRNSNQDDLDIECVNVSCLTSGPSFRCQSEHKMPMWLIGSLALYWSNCLWQGRLLIKRRMNWKEKHRSRPTHVLLPWFWAHVGNFLYSKKENMNSGPHKYFYLNSGSTSVIFSKYYVIFFIYVCLWKGSLAKLLFTSIQVHTSTFTLILGPHR